MSNAEELLVILVSNYKELYDTGNYYYSNLAVKDNCWLEIAKEMNLTVTACKQKWKRLRDCFRKAMKARKSKSGDSAKKIRPWRLEKQMAFLLPFIDERQQISNWEENFGDEAEEDAQDDSTQDDATQDDALDTDSIADLTPTPSPSASTSSLSKRKVVRPRRNQQCRVAAVLDKYLSNKRDSKSTANQDSLTSFFLSMADTVRSLPARMQIEVKSKVFEVVNKAELAALAPPAEQSNYLSTRFDHPPPKYDPDYPYPQSHSQSYQLPMHSPNSSSSFDPNSNPSG